LVAEFRLATTAADAATLDRQRDAVRNTDNAPPGESLRRLDRARACRRRWSGLTLVERCFRWHVRKSDSN
jgi:hypothetical protein